MGTASSGAMVVPDVLINGLLDCSALCTASRNRLNMTVTNMFGVAYDLPYGSNHDKGTLCLG